VGVGVGDSVLGQFQHWWPWLYEVLVFQWGAAMTLMLTRHKLISGNASMTANYPFEAEVQDGAGGVGVTGAKRAPVKSTSVRALLTEYAPVLLQMVYKSLALRISREALRPPVLLDEQFIHALENLVMLLAVEAAALSSGLWASRRLVSALARFLRGLFALVCPNQVVRLIRSYFRAVRRNRRVEEVELRLQMVEEVGWFDHLVAANFPFTVDAPLPLFSFEFVASPGTTAAVAASRALGALGALGAMELVQGGSVQAVLAYTPTGIRGATNPTPYSLTHLILTEVLLSYRQDERKVKHVALEVLRDVLVRQTYDARYQSETSRQRLSCMYLPVVFHFLREMRRISSLRHDAAERKDVLVVLLSLFEHMPDRVLRRLVQELCTPPPN